jgi:polyisoprenoid-binding protein YceI
MKIILAAFLLGAVPAGGVPHAVDVTHSTAEFSVKHIWVERVKGTVPIASGSVVLTPGSAIPVSAAAVLDATQISTGEPDRDNQLKSPDFFDVKRFPTWTFVSTSIVAHGANAFQMRGDLTIRGVTQPESLEVSVRETSAHLIYRAVAQIDRHAFGMPVTRLDSTIGGTVDVTLDIALK